jgi:hypothetical protein
MSSLDERFSKALHATGRGRRQSPAWRLRGCGVSQAGRSALRRLVMHRIDAGRMAVASAVLEQLQQRPGESA